MFYFDDKKHKKPHIHVEYQGKSAVISIQDGKLPEGKIQQNKLKLLDAWIEIHLNELHANWKLALEGQPLFKIEALK